MKSTEPLGSRSSSEVAGALWDEDALIARLAEALEFAEGEVRQLDARGGMQDEELPAGMSFERMVADTAVLLLAASNVSSYAAVGPRILRVASLLVNHARSPHVLRRICLEPALAFEHATAHICLNRLGFYDPDFDAMLDLSVAALASDGRERVPHRILEQEWLRQAWLYPEGLPRMRAGAQMTYCALNRTMDLLAGTTGDVQSFTRALMVLRDFNLYPRPLPRAREILLAEAEGMLARCLAEEDYTLATEVLMAWPLTGAGWSAAASFGFRVVMEAPRQQGDYRSIYTMGLLAAACLAPGRRPPAQIPQDGPRRDVCAAVTACLHGVDAVWMQTLQGLDAEQREPLASFLLCIALQQAFRQRRFGTMEQLLGLGKRLALVPCPTGLQAAEMVMRVARCRLDGSVGKAIPCGAAHAVDQVEALQVGRADLLNASARRFIVVDRTL